VNQGKKRGKKRRWPEKKVEKRIGGSVLSEKGTRYDRIG